MITRRDFVKSGLAIAHRGHVLQKGEIVGAGTAAELRASDVVRHAYLTT